MVKGVEYPEPFTVFVDVGVACDTRCEGPFCSEVESVEECFKKEADDDADQDEGGNDIAADAAENVWGGVDYSINVDEDGNVVIPTKGGHGAVQVPGADEGEEFAGDYVAGIAVGTSENM